MSPAGIHRASPRATRRPSATTAARHSGPSQHLRLVLPTVLPTRPPLSCPHARGQGRRPLPAGGCQRACQPASRLGTQVANILACHASRARQREVRPARCADDHRSVVLRDPPVAPHLFGHRDGRAAAGSVTEGNTLLPDVQQRGQGHQRAEQECNRRVAKDQSSRENDGSDPGPDRRTTSRSGPVSGRRRQARHGTFRNVPGRYPDPQHVPGRCPRSAERSTEPAGRSGTLPAVRGTFHSARGTFRDVAHLGLLGDLERVPQGVKRQWMQTRAAGRSRPAHPCPHARGQDSADNPGGRTPGRRPQGRPGPQIRTGTGPCPWPSGQLALTRD